MAQVDTIFNSKYFHEKCSSGEKQQKTVRVEKTHVYPSKACFHW